MKFRDLSAYEIVKEEQLDDISSKGTVLRHKKTGARVLCLENSDENKVFYIGFRTPVSDSTGVPHIVEHTVLCGSDKYPIKDPFVELAKGSLNTFLNAMTYPDKTVYPVASCNEKDYDNLMDVYLDAVFNPNIYKYEQIFRQEGWHYELEDEGGDITINGVVYNEMKGAFSDPDSVLERYILNSLYPDTNYAFESGGDPENIPDLTYQAYLDFHGKYYHPSNSYIYLYGDHDMAKRLDYIDKEYLSKYDALEVDSEIRLQQPFEKAVEVVKPYPIGQDDDPADKTFLSYNVSLGTSRDIETNMAIDTIEHVLLGMSGAPLKQALIDAGIGEDVYGSFDDSINQPMFQIVAKNANMEDKDRFIQVIRDTVSDIVKNGFNKKALLASINNHEFSYREADSGSYPKGLIKGLNVFDTWLYDDDAVFDMLKCGRFFKSLREKIDTGYFEKLLDDMLLKNPHAAVVIIKPDNTLNTENDKKAKDRLAEYKKSLDADAVRKLVEETKSLKKYQETPDSPESLLCLPVLEREDIKKEIQFISNVETEVDGIKVITHDYDYNGIIYISMYFDITDMTEEETKSFTLLKELIGRLNTAKRSYNDLSIEKNLYMGSLGFPSQSQYNRADGMTKRWYAGITYKVLPENLDPAVSIISEILNETDFSDKKRIREILDMRAASLKSSLSSGGHMTAMYRCMSYHDENARFEEYSSGVEACKYINYLRENFDSVIDDEIAKVKSLIKKIYNRENVIVSLGCDKQNMEKSKEHIVKMAECLAANGRKIVPSKWELHHSNEGLTDASNVQYVCRTGNYRTKGLEYDGSLQVLNTILSYDYLWINVRVQGGAYGCMCGFAWSGLGYFVSYRDPNVKATNDIYEALPEYLRNFECDDRDMLKYIIGTVAKIDRPLSPELKDLVSMTTYLTGTTDEIRRKSREAVLSVTPEVIRKHADIVQAILDANALCVVGNEDKIKEVPELFDSIRKLVED